jgi:hypothetical protein
MGWHEVAVIMFNGGYTAKQNPSSIVPRSTKARAIHRGGGCQGTPCNGGLRLYHPRPVTIKALVQE